MQNTVFSTNQTLNIRGKLVDVSMPRVMGIVNVTPDSFFDGGKYRNEKAILDRVGTMLNEGADFIDVGGYSSRPGAADISIQEESERVIPAVRAIAKTFPDVFMSIDTFRSDIARQAVEEGAVMVNDISGGQLDPSMVSFMAHCQLPYILMHMRGTPQTMNGLIRYDHLWKDLLQFFQEKIISFHDAGVKDLILDPGIGFAKNTEQNFEIVKHLNYLTVLNKPVMVGISRKSFIWKTLQSDPEQALNGSTVIHTIALLKGARWLRVHDVKEAVEAIRLTRFLS